ncbi:MAG: UDP-3-O-acyl-N-acetylglucosamine deacetylase [Bacteroidales bacterium]|nr:UDP-3-O-acyl-N-acetylglucosamine deacetylase [Bacteroidales bacterium]
MKQHTVRRTYTFKGKGLHTGRISTMTVCPAPDNAGIFFVRTDIGPDAVVEAVAENISTTCRSTTIARGQASVSTIEHILSALTGLGIDNARIEIDGPEVPILDGSAKPYIDAILPDGTAEGKADRVWIEVPREITVEDPEHGSIVKITPAGDFSYDARVDFGSRVVGVQDVHFDSATDYATQIGTCRTFVFFHEIEYLFRNNLIKGGDVDNAIVIVEHPLQQSQLDEMAHNFNQPCLSVTGEGYLSNLTLRFPNECGRHKMLDLIGDMRLCGGFLKAHVTAVKMGHTINAQATRAIREAIKNNI